MKILLSRIFLLITAIVMLITTGCRDKFYSSRDTQSTHLAEVPFIYQVGPDDVSEANLEELVTEVDYTLLKLPPEMFFRETLKVIFYGDHTYFLDRAIRGTEASIFCFDQSGSFQYVIDKVGRGPGEYVHLMDFEVTDQYVIVYDKTKFLYYNNKTGEFIKSTDALKMSFVSFTTMHENALLIDGGRFEMNKSKNQIKIYDMDNLEMIYEAIPFNNHSLMLGHMYRYFFKAGDSLSAIPMHSKIVYRVLKKEENYSVKPTYELDFGDAWIPDKLLANSYKNRNRFFEAYRNFVHTPEVFETKDIIYTHYQLHNEDLIFMHDRTSNKSLNIDSLIDNRIGWFGKPFATQGDWIVNLVAPYQVEDSGITPNDQLEKILAQTTDEGQPILVKVRFKIE